MTTSASFRDLPRIDVLLDGVFQELIREFGREIVALEVRNDVESQRDRLKSGNVPTNEITADAIFSRVESNLKRLVSPIQCRVINATGTILHTSLGRAPLAPNVVEAAVREAGQYSCLELDRATGKRSDRDKLVHDLICRVTGAEAATVVNNNAAATMIILNSLADGKEVICSRSQMVEIGGSYRMPDVMRKAGCKLVEIGCTNKHRASDFEDAITDETGMLLKIHTSNYALVGFTAEAALSDIAAIGRKRDIPTVYDLGAGSLVDLKPYGISREETVQELLAQGADLVCFSGDKLFGGPQAGIIVGRADLVKAVKKNALFRMLRCDKVTLALLEHTLKLYLNSDLVKQTVPTLRAITRDVADVRKDADTIHAALAAVGVDATVDAHQSQIGGGSTPGEHLDTFVVRVPMDKPDDAATRLRTGSPSVFCRIEDNALIFDPRPLLPDQVPELAKAAASVLRVE